MIRRHLAQDEGEECARRLGRRIGRCGSAHDLGAGVEDVQQQADDHEQERDRDTGGDGEQRRSTASVNDRKL